MGKGSVSDEMWVECRCFIVFSGMRCVKRWGSINYVEFMTPDSGGHRDW